MAWDVVTWDGESEGLKPQSRDDGLNFDDVNYDSIVDWCPSAESDTLVWLKKQGWKCLEIEGKCTDGSTHWIIQSEQSSETNSELWRTWNTRLRWGNWDSQSKVRENAWKALQPECPVLTTRTSVASKRWLTISRKEMIPYSFPEPGAAATWTMWLWPSLLSLLFPHLMLILKAGTWFFPLTCLDFVLVASLLTSGSRPQPKAWFPFKIPKSSLNERDTPRYLARVGQE